MCVYVGNNLLILEFERCITSVFSPHVSSCDCAYYVVVYEPAVMCILLFGVSYLHKVDAKSHPSQLCYLFNTHTHDTHHLFNCTHIRTTLSPLDVQTDPAGGTQAGRSDSSQLARGMGMG